MSSLCFIHMLVTCCLATVAKGDYDCMCTTSDENVPMYRYPDEKSQIVGVLYKFDCRPIYNVDDIDPQFGAVGNNRQLAYLFLSTNTRVQQCQGNIPGINQVLSTTSSIASTTTSYESTTSTAAKSTIITTIPTTATFSTTTSNQTTTTTILTTTTDVPTDTTTQSTTISTVAATSTSALTTVKTTTPFSGISGCPTNIVQHSHPGYLFREGDRCYEYVLGTSTWYDARDNCHNKGGSLVSIKNKTTQDYLYSLKYQLHMFNALWIGLHDQENEETWKWSSDDSVATYTNWMTSRYEDIYHDQEDCAVFVYRRHGQWDDVVCDGGLHPWICQYDIVTS